MNEKSILLIVCGHGALARAFFMHKENGGMPTGMQVVTFDRKNGLNNTIDSFTPIAIHAGSGKQLPELIAWCEEHNVPLIQASTGMKLPEDFTIPIIDAPNLALPIIAFLKHLPAFVNSITKGIGLDVTNISLIESHQSTKKSVPGTAKKIADASGLAHEQIVSVRDPDKQTRLGVPEANLDRHAYHLLEFTFGNNLRIGLHTKVHGLEPYAAGAVVLAQRIAELSPLPGQSRVWPMTEFI